MRDEVSRNSQNWRRKAHLGASPTESRGAHSRYRSAGTPSIGLLFGVRTAEVEDAWVELLLRCSGKTLLKLCAASDEWAALARKAAQHDDWPFVVGGEVNIGWATKHPDDLDGLFVKLNRRPDINTLRLSIGKYSVALGPLLESHELSSHIATGAGDVYDLHPDQGGPIDMVWDGPDQKTLLHAIWHYIITYHDKLLTIGEYALRGYDRETVTIPASVTTIMKYAFFDSFLTSVTIPERVTTIGRSAFRFCPLLAHVIIQGDTNIGINAFRQCPALRDVTINGSTTIGEEAFFLCTSLVNIDIAGATAIGTEAFEGCSALTSITIPDSVTAIGREAFFGCSSLTSITIPGSVTTIGVRAFENCTSLGTVTIGEGVTTIGGNTFKGCSSLISLTIPDSITDIDATAFTGCTSLRTATIGTGNISQNSMHLFLPSVYQR